VIVARPYSASPAVGSYTKHVEQQQVLVADALRLAQRRQTVAVPALKVKTA
jgi:hypothetical protein